MAIRLLFLADTHLGFDLPARSRVERARRGEDFFAAFEAALAPAFAGAVDVVLHGGDLFYRSRIPAWLAERVYGRLAALAERGVDILWVPGNHERSGVPRSLLLDHPRIRVFDRPRTHVLERGGLRLAFVGIPFAPNIRNDFPTLLAASGHHAVAADVRLLCLHQAVAGATVGPANFVFRDGADVLDGEQLPKGFTAVLSGHIHRAQRLDHDLAGRPLAAPVLYPGSTERTSFAEAGETKSALLLELAAAAGGANELARHQGVLHRGDEPGCALRTAPSTSLSTAPSTTLRAQVVPIAGRPMVDLELTAAGESGAFATRLRETLAALDPRSVVRLRLTDATGRAGEIPANLLPVLRAGALRDLASPTLHLTVDWGNERRTRRQPGPKSEVAPLANPPAAGLDPAAAPTPRGPQGRTLRTDRSLRPAVDRQQLSLGLDPA